MQDIKTNIFKLERGIKKIMNTKAEMKISKAVLLIIGVIAFVFLIMEVTTWECVRHTDCPEQNLCTVNHECYPLPEPQNINIKTEQNFNLAALILGIAIILAVIIYKKWH